MWLARVWNNWRTALVIVKPEAVLTRHRRGFRLFWTWKSRRRTRRPTVPSDVRSLIRTMSRANPLWGAPRIHGELLKLGIDVYQATVAKYMVRPRRCPYQKACTWRFFEILVAVASDPMMSSLFQFVRHHRISSSTSDPPIRILLFENISANFQTICFGGPRATIRIWRVMSQSTSLACDPRKRMAANHCSH